MNNIQLVRRIDRTTVAGGKTDILKLVMSDDKTTHFLYRVGGAAIGVIRGPSKFKDQDGKTGADWIKLVGRFRAQNAAGEIFQSGTAFLPGDISNIIADKLEGDNDQVTFLYDVHVRFDTSLATSYGYIVEPVRKPDETDPLDTLFDAAPRLEGPAKTPALAAPGKSK